MAESLLLNYEGGNLDWEFARQILGVDTLDDPGTPLDRYDERRQVAWDVLTAEEEMRHSLLAAAQTAGLAVDEAEVRAWRATQPEQIRQLRAKLDPQRKMLNMIDGLIELESGFDQAQSALLGDGVPLRRRQRPFIKDVCDFAIHAPRTAGTVGKSGVIQGPTGIGKTALFSKIAAWAKRNEDPRNPTRVLILVPYERIRDQTMGMHGERGIGKFAPGLDAAAYPTDPNALLHEVGVMCNASFNILCAAGKMPHYDVVIADEVDTILGTVTSQNFERYMVDKVAYGLSATTEIAGKSVYDLFEHEISRMTLPMAIRAGLLAPTRGFLLTAEPEVDPSTLPTDPTARRIAMRRARLEARMRIAKPIIQEAVERGDGVIVRCPPGEDIGYAVDYASELRDLVVHEDQGVLGGIRWVTAAPVGGSSRRQSKADRDVIFEGYDAEKVDVLTYVKAIGRGYDSPRAKVFINLDPCSSLTEMIQAHGRVPRLIFGEDGKPREARLYDFVDPELGDRQRTCLHVLGGTKSGELVDHDPVEPARPRPRRKRFQKRVEVLDVSSDTVATIAVGHEVTVDPPSEAEIEASIAVQQGDTPISPKEACSILGIHAPTLKNILLSLGSNPESTLKMEDIRTILELYPGLRAPQLPERGYVSAVKVARQIQGVGFVRSFALLRFAQANGFFPQRFSDESGAIGFYFAEEIVQTVIERYAADYAHSS